MKQHDKLWFEKRGIGQQGFTLVELIITIAILAVISVPLLMYFSDSAKHNSMARAQQNASVAAQDAMEELKAEAVSLTTSDSLLSGKAKVSKGWSLVTPADASGMYVVSRACTVDGASYKVKAEITPVSQGVNDAGVTFTYQEVDKPTMDTETDVIVTETPTFLVDACVYFYGIYTAACEDAGIAVDSSVTTSTIETKLKRTIGIKFEEDTTKTGYVLVTVYYSYAYVLGAGDVYPKGISASTKYVENIEKSSIKASEFSDIYLFFKPDIYGDKLEINGVNAASLGLAKDQIQLYLIAQDSVSATTSLEPGATTEKRDMTYKMVLPTSCGENVNEYIGAVLTNLSSSTPDEVDGGVFAAKIKKDGSDYTLVDKKEKKRVADIKISVYKGDSLAEQNRYLTIEGSKVE